MKIKQGGRAAVVQCFEGKGDQLKVNTSGGRSVSVDEMLNFFTKFTTTLDCYVWLFSSFLIDPNTFVGNEKRQGTK